MGGLAVLARAAGHTVTGCDANVYPPMSTQLEAQGIRMVQGFDPDQLAFRPDLWVIGNVVTRGNPLMEALLERGERFVSGPQWLAEEILRGKHVLAVAGTHGKTTTSSMVAWILEAAGVEPGFLIGGVPGNFGVSARLSDSPWFVIEADEYDTAFFDKRSKFVHYRARVAILNNLEFDHADIFSDLAAIESQFHHFVRILPAGGRLIVNAAEPALERVLARGCWTPVERFGAHAQWSAHERSADCFEVLHAGARVGEVRWELAGAHNRDNALAAIAATRAAGVEPASACEALGRFDGVRRRLELRGEVRGVRVYDDFAHHPTAIATTVAGLRRKCVHGRIIAVLEPRSNTMKLGVMAQALPASLGQADSVYCYTANLGWDVQAALAPLGTRARCEADLGRLVEAVVSDARDGDAVLVMSNGGFGGIHEQILRRLADVDQR